MFNEKIPSDGEISALLDGTAVLSYHPEDFPHWNPSHQHQLTESQRLERAQAIHAHWLKADPSLVQLEELNAEAYFQAYVKSACVTRVHAQGSVKPSAFLLMRPSATTSSKQETARSLGLDECDVTNALDEHEKKYIMTQHEIGHMHDALHNDLKYQTSYESELYAEKYALTAFINQGGSALSVKKSILERTLSAFLKQPEAFWLAPALSQHFFDDMHDVNISNCKDANKELRMRVFNILSADGTLEKVSPQAFREFDEHRTNPDIARALHQYQTQKLCDFTEDKRAIFNALHDIVQTHNIDNCTQKSAELILDAAQLFTPNLLQDFNSFDALKRRLKNPIIVHKAEHSPTQNIPFNKSSRPHLYAEEITPVSLTREHPISPYDID